MMTIKEAYKWIWENTNLMQDTMMFDFECLAYCVAYPRNYFCFRCPYWVVNLPTQNPPDL